MWQCGKCGEQNDDQFEACWNCREPAAGIDPDETQLDILFDPEKPQPVSETGEVQCPTCGQHFNVQSRRDDGTARRRSDHALCPHCGHSVTPELLVRVAAVQRELDAHPVNEVIYACPYCGKVLSISQ